MRRLLLVLALAAAVPSVNAQPPVRERALMLHLTVPLTGSADRPAWRPVRPAPRRDFSGADIATNLSEGWWGIGILAVGGAVWWYQDQKD